jgi:hypothetical protein
MSARTPTIRVEGVDRAVKALNAKLEQYKVTAVSELVRIGLMIQRESQENIKDDGLIDTGNMRASAFTVWTGGPPSREPNFQETGKKSEVTADDMNLLYAIHSATAQEAAREANEGGDVLITNKASVIVAYGAYYSLYVHEDGVSRNWKGAKFLERAVETMASKVGTLLLQGLKGKLR